LHAYSCRSIIRARRWFCGKNNLYTWTNYSGFDPEVNAFATTNGVLGIDYGTYPQVRTFVFGLKANF
jgi:hypothetical protein